MRIKRIQLLGPGLREIASDDFAEAGCAYGFQCSLPQWRTEKILRERLQGLGLEIEFGTEVKSIEDVPDGLRVTLEAGGGTETVTMAYVLGAGGGHSVTRHSMQEASRRGDLRRPLLGRRRKSSPPLPAGVRSPRCRADRVRPALAAAGRPLADLCQSRRGRYRPRASDDRRAGRVARRPAGVEVGLNDLRWVSPFKMHKRVVERLSDGRRFLLGDAAHLSSPLGGEGLNAALMDAADIAWKLSLVVRGAAKASLLDSYAIERGLADRQVLEVSDEVHGLVTGLVATCGDGGVPIVPAGDPAETVAARRKRPMLDVSYAGSALVGQAGAVAAGP